MKFIYVHLIHFHACKKKNIKKKKYFNLGVDLKTIVKKDILALYAQVAKTITENKD